VERIHSTERESSLRTEIEAGEEALASHDGGQFAPPPDENNTGVLSSEYYAPLEFAYASVNKHNIEYSIAWFSNFRCQFIFLGAADERVQLAFHRFDLYESLEGKQAVDNSTSMDDARYFPSFMQYSRSMKVGVGNLS